MGHDLRGGDRGTLHGEQPGFPVLGVRFPGTSDLRLLDKEVNGMRLHDESLRWIYNHIDDFKRAVVALDYAKRTRTQRDNEVFKRADEEVHDYALSFLLMAMGEHPPKTLWSARDYSVLYGVIMDNSDDNEIRDDQ